MTSYTLCTHPNPPRCASEGKHENVQKGGVHHRKKRKKWKNPNSHKMKTALNMNELL